MISAGFQVFKKLKAAEGTLMLSRKADGTNGFRRIVADTESVLPRVNRRGLRLGLLMLAGLAGLVAPTPASATAKPDLVIRSVLAPIPPGAQPGGAMFLQAIVRARNLKGRRTNVVFYLAQDNVASANDVQIASTSIGSSPGSDTAVAVAAHVPTDIPPGFYFIVACVGANCVASQATIQIIGQGLSAAPKPSEAVSFTPAAPEFFPEDPVNGMTIGNTFDCPFSFHGQWPSSCEYVTTKRSGPQPDNAGLFYCPVDHPYPYEVALSWDTLWDNLGSGAHVNDTETFAVSFTRYRNDITDIFSFAGNPNVSPKQRGYFAAFWVNETHTIFQVKYLCSDKFSTDAAD